MRCIELCPDVKYIFGDFKVVIQKSLDYTKPDLNIIYFKDKPFLYLKDIDDCKDVANVLSVFQSRIDELEKMI